MAGDSTVGAAVGGDRAPRTRRVDIAAIAVAILVLGAVVSPVLRRPPRDSFPLSTYPMFSSLISTETPVHIAVGVDGDGDPVTLSPELIAGTEEVIVAGSIVRQAVAAGPEETAALCTRVAARVAGRSGVVGVEIVTEVHDAVAWFEGDREPLERTTHAACEILP